MKSREQLIAEKYRTLKKLLAEFPWLYMMCHRWYLSATDPLPVVIQASGEILRQSAMAPNSWWVVFHGVDHATNAPTFGVTKLIEARLLGEPLRAMYKPTQSTDDLQFIVWRNETKDRQQLVIYRPAQGKTLNHLLA